MKKINVGIYGGKSIFGVREVPRRAETIYCDRCDLCSLYKKRQCLNVTSPFSTYCKYGQDGIILKTNESEFLIKDGTLVCDKYRILFSPFCAKSWHLKTEITDDMVAEITSNDQVDMNTVFKY